MEILTLLVHFFQDYGYFAVFGVLVLCGFGLPVPEDITLIAGGVISALGNTNEHVMFFVGMAGVLFGDSFVFLLGTFSGDRILKNKFVGKYITEERYSKVQEQFAKYGKWVIFMARFMPGLRTPIFLSAGISKRVGYVRFFLTDFMAALISVPFWVYMGYHLAHNFELLLSWMHNAQFIIFSLLGAAIIVFIFIYYKKRGK